MEEKINANTPTPHIGAKFGEIANVVILTGDPNRAKKMAKQFLKHKHLVSKVRGNWCFTGFFENTRVSIMSCGMGAPSMKIYAHELFEFSGVKMIVRVGTCGSFDKNIKIGQTIVASKVFAETNLFGTGNNKELVFDTQKSLVNITKATAKQLEAEVFFAPIYSSNLVYSSSAHNKHMMSLGTSGVEMEAGALFFEAKKHNKKALCILSVSDEIQTGKVCSAQQRENNFEKLFELALCVTKNVLEEKND